MGTNVKRVPPNLQPPECRIYYSHIRYESADPSQSYDTHGGITIAYRYLKDLNKWEVAIAKCNLLDNFCKRLGRTIASNRLDWGVCHRLDLELDDSKLKDVTHRVRAVVSEKEGLLWSDPDEPDKPGKALDIYANDTIH